MNTQTNEALRVAEGRAGGRPDGLSDNQWLLLAYEYLIIMLHEQPGEDELRAQHDALRRELLARMDDAVIQRLIDEYYATGHGALWAGGLG